MFYVYAMIVVVILGVIINVLEQRLRRPFPSAAEQKALQRHRADCAKDGISLADADEVFRRIRTTPSPSTARTTKPLDLSFID